MHPGRIKNPEFIAGCSECLLFPHCQYTASLNFDTFPESFRSTIIGNYVCGKGLLSDIPGFRIMIRGRIVLGQQLLVYNTFTLYIIFRRW